MRCSWYNAGMDDNEWQPIKHTQYHLIEEFASIECECGDLLVVHDEPEACERCGREYKHVNYVAIRQQQEAHEPDRMSDSMSTTPEPAE